METDAVEPAEAYPASKIAAEATLRESGLNWSILRFPFVYGDGDGHLAMLPRHVAAFGFHPANRMSTVHHRDIATATKLALDGTFDGHIVNIADEAPTTIYELVDMVGESMPPSCEPMPDPWHLHIDASLARSLGFRPIVRTVYQAAQEGIL
ncbi:RmlD substrate binding domain-containing protein [Sphingomonas faeni]|uniref:RmlD substrate binding domain-containing protein n=1 Tax=Sphingomonas faeni TaxID=185950 RepID=A0A2T5U769_9SPHN|nr:RmlD substrate binding domain-containing protein [Sphingomonas faeni]